MATEQKLVRVPGGEIIRSSRLPRTMSYPRGQVEFLEDDMKVYVGRFDGKYSMHVTTESGMLKPVLTEIKNLHLRVGTAAQGYQDVDGRVQRDAPMTAECFADPEHGGHLSTYFSNAETIFTQIVQLPQEVQVGLYQAICAIIEIPMDWSQQESSRHVDLLRVNLVAQGGA